MKVGVIADSHDHAERVRVAISLLKEKGAQLFFHCGDLTNVEVVQTFKGHRSFFVFGNNDKARDEIKKAVRQTKATLFGDAGMVEIAGKKIAMTHGHLKPEVRKLLALSPDYLFLGHSHLKKAERKGMTLILNPGALHRTKQWTCALLDTATDRVTFVEVRDRKSPPLARIGSKSGK